MKKTFLLSALFFTSAFITAQQAPNIQWAVCLGGTTTEGASQSFAGSPLPYGLQALQTPDGGYILAGNTNGNSGYITGFHGTSGYTTDMWVVKTDSSGNFQWQKTLGGTGYDSAAAIALTNDGGYIIAGYSTVADGDVTHYYGSHDIWIVKLDGAGNKVWTKNLGTTGDEQAFSIQQTSDGGYIIGGTYSNINDTPVAGYNMRLIKTNATGDIQWQKSLGGSADEVAYSVQQTADGGYILAGSTQSKNDGDVTGNHLYWNSGEWAYLASKDAWIVKLNSAGTLEWQKCLGGTGEDTAYSVQQTTDGGYILAGSSNSTNGDVTGNHGNHDFWIAKLNANGTLTWQKSLGGSKADIGHFVKQTPDGGYIATGYSFSSDGDVTGHHGSNNTEDYWVVKLTESGNLSWNKSLGGTNGDTAHSLDLTQDGGYVIAGVSNSVNGDVVGMHPNSSATDFWLVKLGSGNLDTKDIHLTNTISLFPNPVKDQLFLSEELKNIEVYTSVGKIVSKISHAKTINLHHLPPNVYFLRGQNKDGNMIVKKIIKQ